MSVYYNEIDPFCVQWLRNLIDAGHIAKGDVDDRSIVDVKSSELAGYAQCHFFAGIGCWSYALHLAGWPDDRPVWTGSCPCQPFSIAGKGKGEEDERHLWPEWYRLVRECKPPVIFGEQVAAAIGHGWLDSLQSDLEGEGYAVGKAVLGACSVGAPHIRQRLYFVANSEMSGKWTFNGKSKSYDRQQESSRGCSIFIVGDTNNERSQGWSLQSGKSTSEFFAGETSLVNGFWRDAEWIWCQDQKFRPTKPRIFPLAHGSTSRVGRLRAYGNAIVPQVAAEFIKAYMETCS